MPTQALNEMDEHTHTQARTGSRVMSRTELCIFACQDKQSIRAYDSWASRLKFLGDVAGFDWV